MSLTLLKDSFASWAHEFLVRSASILYGCLGFTLSVMAAGIHFLFPALLRTRVPPKSAVMTRTPSRQTVRRKISDKVTLASSSSSSGQSADTAISISPQSNSLKLPIEIHPPLPQPVDGYFPPMTPSPTSEVPQVVVTKTSLDQARDHHPGKTYGDDIGRKPEISRASTIAVDSTLRGSRSMSFFKSKCNNSSKTPPSDAPTREKERKKKPPLARPRTQPYEAPYFFPTPTAPSSTEYLRPRPEPVRSFTMPAPQRKAS
ncbi:hypothetical protein F5880DRAFT_1607629 [Lentinula raphanica]|nr:hypothetical protein F5880DRAFT_1607629 [Lentinula raphanica]